MSVRHATPSLYPKETPWTTAELEEQKQRVRRDRLAALGLRCLQLLYVTAVLFATIICPLNRTDAGWLGLVLIGCFIVLAFGGPRLLAKAIPVRSEAELRALEYEVNPLSAAECETVQRLQVLGGPLAAWLSTVKQQGRPLVGADAKTMYAYAKPALAQYEVSTQLLRMMPAPLLELLLTSAQGPK